MRVAENCIYYVINSLFILFFTCKLISLSLLIKLLPPLSIYRKVLNRTTNY